MADKKQLAQLIKSYVEQDSAPEARQSIVKELIETTARAPGAALVLDLITDRVKSTPPSSQLHLIHLLEQLVTTESLEGSVEAANARVQYVTSGAWMDRFVTVTKKEIQVPENRSAVEAWIWKLYSHYGNLHAVQRAVERLHLQDVGLTCDSSQRSGTSQADAGSTFLPPAIDTISTHSEEFHPILTPSPSFVASGRGHVQRSNTENEAPHDTPRLLKPSKSSPRLTSFRNLYEKIKSSQASSSPATSEPSSPSAGAGPSDTMGLFPSSVARSIVEELQADVSNVTMGLQRPSLMRPDVVADIRRNQKHLDELLENGNLTKSVRQQLLQLQKDVQEALSLHDAIHGKEKSQNATPSSAHEEIPDSVLQDLQEEKERLELKLQTLRSRNVQFQTDINERLRSLDRCLDAGVGVPEMQNASTVATTTRTTTNHRSQQDALVRAMVRTSQHCTTVQQLVGQLRQLGQSTKQLVTKCGGIQEVCRSFPDCLHNDRNVTLAETRRMQETYMEEMALRKHYYNMIQELKGNIRVYCRVRPMSEKEKAAHASVVHFPRPDELVLQENEARNRTFEFDAVFDPETPQVKVFEDTKPLIDSVVDGYNVCIFAYGQTGSGKTYTMSGPNEDHGINRRALARLFEIIEERNHTDTFTVHVSALEIYNEEIRDLQRKRSENAGLSFDIKTGGETGHYVTNLTSTPVTTLSEVESVIHRASSNRSEGRTNMNLHSSRSHMILYVVVRSVNKETGFKTYGKLSLVDLAGSERLDKSGAVGEAKTEATFINKSLTALGMVMSSLSASAQHVPYRNSKLTFLLQDSMTGQAKVLMFVCVSGCSYNISESMSSLQFASRVRGINLGKAQRNVS